MPVAPHEYFAANVIASELKYGGITANTRLDFAQHEGKAYTNHPVFGKYIEIPPIESVTAALVACHEIWHASNDERTRRWPAVDREIAAWCFAYELSRYSNPVLFWDVDAAINVELCLNGYLNNKRFKRPELNPQPLFKHIAKIKGGDN